jgi:hypothetical protein
MSGGVPRPNRGVFDLFSGVGQGWSLDPGWMGGQGVRGLDEMDWMDWPLQAALVMVLGLTLQVGHNAIAFKPALLTASRDRSPGCRAPLELE